MIEDLQKLDNKYFPYPWNNIVWKDTDVKIYPDLGKYTAFIKKIDDKLVGYALFLLEDTSSLLKLIVDPLYRRKGIARNLMLKAISLLDDIYLEVEENNSSAISLYESLGFKQINYIKKFYSDGNNARIFFREKD